jgi:hypothetical protein
MNSIEPHTKLYSIENRGEHPEMNMVKVEHTVKPFFTVQETIDLMKRYAHLTYIAVQASRAADRCDREGKGRGMVKYVTLMNKAVSQQMELETKMIEWSKL